jgi:hypothetical protein
MSAEESPDDKFAELQLQKWVETAIMLLSCASLLLFCQMFTWSYAWLLVPITVLEIKQILIVLFRFPSLCM